MAKYRRKPVVVEAEQFWPKKHPWPEGVRKDWVGFFISTLEGIFDVIPGDWIITGINGEKHPCKPDIFEATYEPIEEGEST